MTVIQALIELQDVDGRIRELEHELKDLPRRKALETARLSGVSDDLTAAKAKPISKSISTRAGLNSSRARGE